MPTMASGTFFVSNQKDNILAVKIDGLNTGDLHAAAGSAVDQIDPTTGAVTPVVSGLNAAHGLLFVPAAPGVPDLTALFQTLAQDFAQAFANLGVSTGQDGASGAAGTTTGASILSSFIGNDSSGTLAGLLPIANG